MTNGIVNDLSYSKSNAQQNLEKSSLYSVFKIFLLLLAGGLSLYFSQGSILGTVYFSILLVLFLRAKDNIFWIATFFIMMTYPWGLFFYRWNNWFFALTPTVGISFFSILPIIIYLKFRVLKNGSIPLLKLDYFEKKTKILIFLVVLLTIWGFVWGYSITQLTFMLDLTSWLLLFTLPKLMVEKQLVRLNSIIFLFVLLYVPSTLVDLVANGVVSNFITFGSGNLAGTAVTQDLVRQTGGIYLCLYAIVMSLYYLVKRHENFNHNYLLVIIFFSFTFIVNSATRGWMIATGFILIIFILRFGFKVVSAPKLVYGAIFIFLLGVYLPNAIRSNLGAALERFGTVQSILEGDLSAGGTAARFEERGPRALTRFDESPLFGFGLSKITEEYYDRHVGNHVILLTGGYFGFVAFYTIIFSILYSFYTLSKITKEEGMKVLGLGFVAILIINGTSRSMISFILPYDTAFFLGLLFNHANAILNEKKTGIVLRGEKS